MLLFLSAIIFVFTVLVRCIVYTLAHDLLCLCSLHILILDTGFLFLLDHRWSFVQTVVRPKAEDKDMISRVDTLFLNLAENRVLPTVNRLVLVVHNSTCAHGSVVSEIPRKARDGGNDNDYPEFSAFFTRSDASVDDGPTNCIVYGGLFFTCGCYEELVLDVDVVLRIPYDFTVGVLYTMFCENTAAPVSTAADNLCMDGSLVLMRPRLCFTRCQRMMDVFSYGMLGSLDSDQVLVFPFPTFHGQPVEAVISLVLVTLDKIPAKNKVLCNIVHAISDHTHGHIMPRHTSVICLAELIRLPVFHGLEIHDAIVVEVLSREHFVGNTCGMYVGTGMLSVVPSPEAEIQASNKGQSVINHDELLMMRPVESHVASVLEDIVIRVSHHRDVAMPRGSLRAQGMKSMLRVSTVAADSLGDFLIHYHVYLDSSFGPPLQDLIQSPFLVVVGRSPQKQLGTHPPILDIDGLLGVFQGNRDGVEVVPSVDIPLDLVAISLRGKGLEAVAFSDLGALVIGGLLVLLVVTMIGVDDIPKLADLVLEMDRAYFGIIEMGIWGTCC